MIGGRFAMRVLIFGLLVSLLVSTGAAAQSAEPDGRSADHSVLPANQEPVESRREGAAQQSELSGAVPQSTQAEKTRKAEQALQNQLLDIAQALANLEKRVREMRRYPDSPPRWDVERTEQDVNLLAQELGKVATAAVSPLAELQRNDQRDRLFELQLSMEIAKRRWGGAWSIFGMDFFASAPPAPKVEQRPAPQNYRLRIGDKLRVAIMSSLGQESEYHPVVDTSGNVYVPGAGTVRASQKTCDQLRQSVTSKIGSRFKQLRVAVAVESMATMLVEVAGDVARPGAYTLTGMPTVLNALYQAGGPTKSGTFRKIELTREGEPKRTVDLYDFLMHGNRNQDLPLKDGDLVFVPPVGPTIIVDGDVTRPARYEPGFPITLGAALKMAGGVRATGYLQTVQVERIEHNEYRVLLNESVKSGDGLSAFALKPGDAITVTSVRADKTNQVDITGPVRAPGLYGFADGMRVADLLKLARGLDPNDEVYGGRADILRANPMTGAEIVTFSLDRALAGDPEHNLELRKLDRLFIYEPDQVIFRPRLVTIVGAVAKPGTYRRTEGMRMSDAVAAAGGILPEAYLDRAEVIRQATDGTSELIRIELQKAMSGDVLANTKLQDRDKVTVYNYADVEWSNRTVRIEGAVQRQGVYTRSTNMRVSDLMFACGGRLLEAASEAEVGRCAGGGRSTVMRVDLTKLVSGSPDDLVLEDRDVVTVPADNPSLRSSEVVFVTGEVVHPGPYSLNGRNERLTDLIKRGGGLTEYADARGMLFLRQRESFENSQQGRDADLILEKSRAFADKQFVTHLAKLGIALPTQFIQAVQQPAEKLAKPSEVVAEEKLKKDVNLLGTAPVGAQGTTEKPFWEKAGMEELKATAVSREAGKLEEPEKASAMGPRVAESEKNELSGFEGRQELALQANSTRISVDLNRAFQDAGSPDNIPLRQGDHVFIPRVTNVVTVIGAVLHPHPFAAKTGNSVDYFIRKSGGFAQDAAKGNVVVVRSNGDALPKDQVRTVEPGDMIIVPTTGLIDIAKKWERLGSVTKVLSDILSSAFILTRF